MNKVKKKSELPDLEDFDDSLDFLKKTRIIARNVKQNENIYPLDYELEEFNQSDDLLKLLANSDYGDIVTIFINSDGGRVDIADLICNRIREARRRGVIVNAELGFTVASAATFIALACDNIFVSDSCTFMVHCWSSGLGYSDAKAHLSEAEFNKKQSDAFLKRVYKDFLTEDEIEDLIDNPKDIYLNAEEVRERWGNKVQNSPQQEDDLSDLIDMKIQESLVKVGILPKPKAKKK